MATAAAAAVAQVCAASSSACVQSRPIAPARAALRRAGPSVAPRLPRRQIVRMAFNFKKTETAPEPVRTTSVDTEALQGQLTGTIDELKAKWDATEEKYAVVALTLSGFVAVWAISGVVGAVDRLPLVSNLLELVGIFYSAYFVYRYLLFKPNRAELFEKLQQLKAEIFGQ
eukprot:jgi/Chlat1/6032/Chrsp4S09086